MIIFLLLAAALLWRFFTTSGRAMLAMMNGRLDDMADHEDQRACADGLSQTHEA